MGIRLGVFIEFFQIALNAWLSTQFAYGLTILFLGRIMINYFESAIEEDPDNIFNKMINILMYAMFGSGYVLYKKFQKFSWIIQKSLFLIALFIQGLVSIFIYVIIKGFLNQLF